MQWIDEVFAHTCRYECSYVESCIQESIDITFTKLVKCLFDELTPPIHRVEQHPQMKRLYISQEIFLEFEEDTKKLTLYHNDDEQVLQDPLELIHWLSQLSKGNYDYDQLKVEIENHLINQAMSITCCQNMPKSDHPLLQGEQYVIQGHNIHPCAKTKLGLSFQEVMQYSPEYNQAFKLNWILVKRGLLFNNLSETEMQTLVDFSGYLAEIPPNYDLIPVHPYQFAHVLEHVYAEEIANQDIILLKHRGGLVKSTSSFRTVCPIDGVTPILKLPVNSQMTSTIRSISNNSIINSRNIGEYFNYIYNNDARLADISFPVQEYGGMTYRHSQEDKQRNLSFILRENNAQYIPVDASLYTATCLFERNEAGEKVYTTLVDMAQSLHQPLAWFKQYTRLLVETALTLMTKYGVGLEAHLQNMSFEFQYGIPTRLHVRDFGGLRIDSSRIPEWVELTQALTNATTEGMYEKVQNTLISNHLQTLVTHFSQDYGYAASTLWQYINAIFQATFDDLEAQGLAHAEADRSAFYTETINEKALLTMRIAEESQDIYVKRANPLLVARNVQV